MVILSKKQVAALKQVAAEQAKAAENERCAGLLDSLCENVEGQMKQRAGASNSRVLQTQCAQLAVIQRQALTMAAKLIRESSHGN